MTPAAPFSAQVSPARREDLGAGGAACYDVRIMTTVTLEQAQAMLPELIEKLAPGEPVLITRDARPVAQLTPVPADADRPQPVPGRCKGMLWVVAEDEQHRRQMTSTG